MSRDHNNQQNQMWLKFQQSQPKFLTEDGIRQIIELYYQAITRPRTLQTFQILKNISKQWILQIVDLNIKSRHQEEYVCFISDGFSKMPCLITGQAANQIQFGIMKNYSIITIKDYDFTIRQGNVGKQLKSGRKLLVLERCEVRCRRRALIRNIGDPMPYLQYKRNNYQNENGSLNIVKAQYLGTIVEATANYNRAAKEFPSIMVTVTQMPKSVYKDFLNIKVRDQYNDVIQASCFSRQVVKVLFQKIKLHQTYILREYEMRRNGKTQQLEVRLLQRESLILYEDSQYTAKKKKMKQKKAQQVQRLQMQAFYISLCQECQEDQTNYYSNQNSLLQQFQNKQPKQNEQPEIANNQNQQRNQYIAQFQNEQPKQKEQPQIANNQNHQRDQYIPQFQNKQPIQKKDKPQIANNHNHQRDQYIPQFQNKQPIQKKDKPQIANNHNHQRDQYIPQFQNKQPIQKKDKPQIANNHNHQRDQYIPQFQNKQPIQKKNKPQIANNHNHQRNNLIQDKRQKQVQEKNKVSKHNHQRNNLFQDKRQKQVQENNKVSKYQDPKNSSQNLRLIQPQKQKQNNNLKKIREKQPTQSLQQMYNEVEEYRKALQLRQENQIISINKPQKYYNCQCFVQLKVKSLHFNGSKQRGHFFQILCKRCRKDEVFKSHSDNVHEQRSGKFICGRCGQDQLTFRWNMKAVVMDDKTSIDCSLQDEITQKFLQLSAKEGYNLYRTNRDSFAKLLKKLNYVYRYCKFMPKIVEQEHSVKVYYNILQIYSQVTDKTLKNIHQTVQKITSNLNEIKKYQKQQQQKITEGNKQNKGLFEHHAKVWNVYNKYKRN